MSHGLRILLAEDETAVAASVVEQLRALGHQVVGEAITGEEAVRLATELRPDVVIMDIVMPDCDGIEAAHRIAKHSPVPVIFLSAYFDEELLSGVIDAGGLAYLLKPANSEQVQAALELVRARFAEMRDLKEHIARLNRVLEVRKVVARAKGILMQRHGIGEQDAHRRLQQEASRRNMKLADLALAIVSAEPLIAGGEESPFAEVAGDKPRSR